MLRPPNGSPEDSRHYLKASNVAPTLFVWKDGLWMSPGTSYGTKPSSMVALGWSYDRPAARRSYINLLKMYKSLKAANK